MGLIPLDPNIVAFQWDALGAIAHWDATEKLWAAFSLGLDFLYLVSYAAFFALGCVEIANRFQYLPLAKLGIVLAWGQGVAAGFDSLENISLFAILLGSQNEILALVARVLATLKFALILAGLLYIGMGWSTSKIFGRGQNND